MLIIHLLISILQYLLVMNTSSYTASWDPQSPRRSLSNIQSSLFLVQIHLQLLILVLLKDRQLPNQHHHHQNHHHVVIMLQARLQHDHLKEMIDQSLVVLVEEVVMLVMGEEEVDFLLLHQFKNKNLQQMVATTWYICT